MKSLIEVFCLQRRVCTCDEKKVLLVFRVHIHLLKAPIQCGEKTNSKMDFTSFSCSITSVQNDRDRYIPKFSVFETSLLSSQLSSFQILNIPYLLILKYRLTRVTRYDVESKVIYLNLSCTIRTLNCSPKYKLF